MISPVMTIAAAGLLQNTGLAPSSQLLQSTSAYESVPVVQQFLNLLPAAQSQLKAATFQSLAKLGSTNLPAVTNVIPASLTSSLLLLAPNGIYIDGLTGLIVDVATGIMGDGDLSKFTQIFNSATGYAVQASSFIAASQNTQALSITFGPTTGGMNNLITGSFNQVTTSFTSLAADFSKLGNLINLNDLANLGDPITLLQQVGTVAGSELPALSQALGAVGISANALNSLIFGYSDVTASVQKNLYVAFEKVTGNDLEQVKAILGVTTGGITNMAQLLDPKKILPNSYLTLTVPTPDGLQPVYTASGAINTNIEKYLQEPTTPSYPGDDAVTRARLGLQPIPTRAFT